MANFSSGKDPQAFLYSIQERIGLQFPDFSSVETTELRGSKKNNSLGFSLTVKLLRNNHELKIELDFKYNHKLAQFFGKDRSNA